MPARRLVVMKPTGIALALLFALLGAACGAADAPRPAATADVAESMRLIPSATPSPSPSAACVSESADRYGGRALISVTSPCPEETISSGAKLAGDANVFEATVSYRLLDADGGEIASGFTTAECGTGCWGAFAAELEFESAAQQEGTLEVFESSARDGSSLHVVAIPVVLVP